MGDADERITAQPPKSWIERPRVPVGLLGAGWRTVHRALHIAHLGLMFTCLAAFLLLLVLVGALFMSRGPERAASPSALALQVVFYGMLVLQGAGLVTLAGEGTLCRIPFHGGVRSWAVAAVILSICGKLLATLAVGGCAVSVLFALGELGSGETSSAAHRTWVITLLAASAGVVASFGEIVLLALALRALAFMVDCPKLGSRAADYARFFVISLGLLTALNLLIGAARTLLPEALATSDGLRLLAEVLIVGEWVCWVILLGQLASLVDDLRDAVAAARGRQT
jgi:hypothetical protein